MSMRAIGGETGDFLTTTCHVITTYQSKIAPGKFVQWSTSSNWGINSCADAANIISKGIVVALSDDSSVATVKWIGFNKIISVPYSGTPTLGQAGQTETANGTKVTPSANATVAVYNVVVAYASPKAGQCYIATY